MIRAFLPVLALAAVSMTTLPVAAGARSRSRRTPTATISSGPTRFRARAWPREKCEGPFTLPSQAYPGTQHTYWVYVPAQYNPSVPASLMIFNDGQAFKNMEGDLRAPNVLDNLIDRREIPVMLAVFINPGRTPEQPEPTPQEWGDRTTNRPTEYNTLDDQYARVIVDELMPALYKDYAISKDPEQHGIGGASSGAIAAFTVAWERPNDFRKVLSIDRQLHEPARRPRLPRDRSQERQEADPDFHAGRTQRQPRRRPGRDLRRDPRLVLPERPADEGAHGEGLRPELCSGASAGTVRSTGAPSCPTCCAGSGATTRSRSTRRTWWSAPSTPRLRRHRNCELRIVI